MAAETAAAPDRLDRERVLAWLQEYGVYAAVLALLLFNILFTPNFLDVGNFRTQLVQVTPIAIAGSAPYPR
jgi:ribose/xylose/arabinose/galactoside ABC-type transport system permease subunit